MNKIAKYSEQTFEDIKHITETGQEFWYARELQGILEYFEWRNFLNAIEKAKIACLNSGLDALDHFVDVNKMVVLGSGAERKLEDLLLSRYACYLIVMNGWKSINKENLTIRIHVWKRRITNIGMIYERRYSYF